MTEKRTALDYWFVVYDRRLAMVLVVLATMGTTALLSVVIPPVYEARVSFYVPSGGEAPSYFTPEAVSSIRRSVLSPISDEAEYAGYLGILKSEALAERIVAEFPHKTVKNLIRKDIDFEVSEEYVVELYARDRNGPISAALANAYVREFDRLMQDYSAARTDHTIATIGPRLTETEAQLEAAAQKLVDIKQREGLVSVEDEINQVVQQKLEFQTQRERTAVELSAKDREVQAIEARMREEGKLLDDQALLVVDGRLQELEDNLLALEDQRVALTLDLGERHPEVLVLDRQAEWVRKEMARQADRIIQGEIKSDSTYYEQLRRQLAQAYVDRQSLEASIRAFDHVAKTLAGRDQHLTAVERELEAAQNIRHEYQRRRDALRTELQEAKMQREQPVPAVIQVDVAYPPETPIFPIFWLNILVGAILGVVAGIYYCFLADYIEKTNRTRILRLMAAIRATDSDAALAPEPTRGK